MPKKDFFIPEPVLFALDRLHAAGYPAYVVGGCVRDFLMNRTPGDYDVTTAAKPERTLEVFADCRVVETGLKHGTVTLVYGGMNIEITTYRVDGAYLDGRHPEAVTFTDDLAEDLCRRDFTVNAMAYDPRTGVVDYHGGLRDIENRVISCVGSAEQRFSEDGLRIFRAMRFASVLDFTTDDECDRAIHKLSGLLEKISRERIYVELTKLLGGVAAPRILRQYGDIVAQVLPGLSADAAVRTADALVRMRRFCETNGIILGKSGRDALHYALLFAGEDGKKCRALMQSLKPSREELRGVEAVQKAGNSDGLFEGETLTYAVKNLMRTGGEGFPKQVVLYKYALEMTDEEFAVRVIREAERLRESGACVSLAGLRITGNDLISLGFGGAAIGRTLNALLELVMREELANDPEALRNAAKTLV